MGLINKNGANILGIDIKPVYAKINRIQIERDNLARVFFGVSNSRENIDKGLSLEERMFECYINKDDKIYEQVYNLAKENLFLNWEDDIVEIKSINTEGNDI